MTDTMLLALIGGGSVLLLGAILFLRKRKKKLNHDDIARRWHELQMNCKDKKTWYVAVTEADRLVDEVVKKLRYKGKTTGERLVSAQHDFSNNESLWFGHKLYNRIIQDDYKKLSKQDTLEALSGFRQALKDLGALKDKPAPVAEEANTKTDSSGATS